MDTVRLLDPEHLCISTARHHCFPWVPESTHNMSGENDGVIRKTYLSNIFMQDISENSINIAHVYEVLARKEKLLLIMFFQTQLNNNPISGLRLYYTRGAYCVIFYVGVLDEFGADLCSCQMMLARSIAYIIRALLRTEKFAKNL